MKINNINNSYTANKKSNVSFNGKVSDAISNFYGKLASTDTFQNGIKKIAKYDTFTHLLVAESCILSGFYMINTIKNKNIDDEQKPQMLINDALTLGFSTAGAYLAEDKISDVVNKKAEKYFTNNKDFYMKLGRQDDSPIKNLLDKTVETFRAKNNPEEFQKGINDTVDVISKDLKKIVKEQDEDKAFQITKEKLSATQENIKQIIEKSDNEEKLREAVKKETLELYENAAARKQADIIKSGINKGKVLLIFGFIYRFIGPVAITPIANKLSSMFFPSKNELAAQKKALHSKEEKFNRAA